MTNYELAYSNFLANITKIISDFAINNYANDRIIMKKENDTEKEPINEFVNVDNDKVELIDYYNNSQKTNKTILCIVGAIILYSLLRGK